MVVPQIARQEFYEFLHSGFKVTSFCHRADNGGQCQAINCGAVARFVAVTVGVAALKPQFDVIADVFGRIELLSVSLDEGSWYWTYIYHHWAPVINQYFIADCVEPALNQRRIRAKNDLRQIFRHFLGWWVKFYNQTSPAVGLFA